MCGGRFRMFEGVLLYVEEGGLEYSLRWEFGVWYLVFGE